MYNKNKKQQENTVEPAQETVPQDTVQNAQEKEFPQNATSNILRETSSSEACDAVGCGSFVIKKTKEKGDDILKSITLEEFIGIYPNLHCVISEKTDAPLLILLDKAIKGIKAHISWGKKTRDNIHEQGGILIGNPYCVNEQIISVVESVIPAVATRASGAYLEMGTEAWIRMLDTYDELYKDKGLFVVGWFHTHPNMLSVFMSGTDMGTQRAFFNQSWHFAIVLNPHRKLIACFNSEKARPSRYYPGDFIE